VGSKNVLLFQIPDSKFEMRRLDGAVSNSQFEFRNPKLLICHYLS
jgi:hypothetical protein